jgi:hypothetical protein
MCNTALGSPFGSSSATSKSLTGTTLDSLQTNGQRLLKLPSQTAMPKLKGISLVDLTQR